MRETGLLRDPRQYSLISHFLPSLEKATMDQINAKKDQTDAVDGYTMNTLRGNARAHKDAIQKEYK